MKDVIIGLIILIIAITLLCGGIILVFSHTSIEYDKLLPVNLIYRFVESTGVYGSAEYYVFDDNGARYKVTQKYFDSRIDLERK